MNLGFIWVVGGELVGLICGEIFGTLGQRRLPREYKKVSVKATFNIFSIFHGQFFFQAHFLNHVSLLLRPRFSQALF